MIMTRTSIRRFACLLPAALLLGCAGNTSEDQVTGVRGGRLYAEQRPGATVLDLGDSVLLTLEPPGLPHAGDTDAPGSDRWEVMVDRPLRIVLGVEGVPDVVLDLVDPRGLPVASVRSGEPAKRVSLSPGRHRVRVANDGAMRRFVWAGWREPNEASRSVAQPGIYVTELSSPPTRVAGTQTSVPLFVGLAAPPYDAPTLVTSAQGFAEQLRPPPGSSLASAVEQFFANGGQQAYVVSVPDASLASHRSALSAAASLLGIETQFVLAPDMTTLDLEAWAAVAKVLATEIDERAVLVLDPPFSRRTFEDTVDLQDALTGLPSPSFACLYWPYLVDSDGELIPPSGVAAGIWAANDRLNGVWGTPAGRDFPLPSIQRPEIVITDAQQAQLNSPVDGHAINAYRQFIGVTGTWLWAARTLDAISHDYGYLPQRRLLLYIEQSLSQALQSFVFLPNDSQTWDAVVTLFAGFLQGLWQQGALIGNTANSAFQVLCGLGSTMTAQDIVDGLLVAEVQVAVATPAEYVSLTFTLQLQN